MTRQNPETIDLLELAADETCRLDDLFRSTASLHPDRVALIDQPGRSCLTGEASRRLTYAETQLEARRLAAGLLDLGISANDVILAQLPNVVEGVVLFLAAAQIGAIVSPVPVQYRRHELDHVIRKARPKAYCCAPAYREFNHAQYLATLDDALPIRIVTGTQRGSGTHAMADLGSSLSLRDLDDLSRKRSADDLFTLGWTSGTEGEPKGIPRNHRQWISICRGTLDDAELRPGDVIMNAFPMTNLASIGGGFVVWLLLGGTLVLHQPFDMEVFLMQLRDEKVTWTTVPPAILNRIAQQSTLLASDAFDSLRSIASGSAPLAPSMIEAFGRRGIQILNCFGSNEGVSLVCGPRDTTDPVQRATLFPRENDGATARGLRLKIVDRETGERILDPGHAGELAVAGPGVFSGYWRAPELNLTAFDAEGYYLSGDLFEIAAEDPKFFRYLGRCKDLIIRGGVNISPAEIDNIFSDHPKLVEVAAIGVPDPVLGERVCLAVVSKKGEYITLPDLVAWAAAKGVARYKWPESLLVMETLPRNPLQKVLRRELRIAAAGKL